MRRETPTSITSGLFGFVCAVGLLLFGDATAGSNLTGDEVAAQVNARDEGVAVSRNMRIELIDKNGGQRVRTTRFYRKYYGDEKRTVIFYISPRNVRGTGMLTFDYANQEDDQWLYLPALRKVRRIPAADRGDYFLGTDLTYEDVKKESKLGVDDYHFVVKAKETVDGKPGYVLESRPINEEVGNELGYGRVVHWIDSVNWVIHRSEFWDQYSKPLKSVRILDVRKIQGVWTSLRIEVDNHKTGHKTRITYSDVDFESGVDDRLFSKGALRKGG